MDEQLQSALATGAPPFDGETLHLADLLPLEALSCLLSVTVMALREEHEESALLRLDDWHEHDGYVSPSQSTDWQSLVSLVASPATLYEQRPGDEFVNLGFYEPRGKFYLRIWVPDEDDDPHSYPGKWGAFDLSGPAPLVRKIAESLQSEAVRFSAARQFFDERYAG